MKETLIIPEIFEKFPVVAWVSTLDTYSEDLQNSKNWKVPEKLKAMDQTLSAVDLTTNPNYVQQIHSADFSYVDENFLNGEKGDWVWTNLKNTPLVVSWADCTLIMVYVDQKNPIIWAFHSGWQGTTKWIMPKFFNGLFQSGVSANDIYVYISPNISQKYYEFGDEVYDFFDKKYVEEVDWKLFLDVSWCVYDQVIKAWVKGENIERSNLCTYQSDLLPSYRKQWKNCPRIFSIISLK